MSNTHRFEQMFHPSQYKSEMSAAEDMYSRPSQLAEFDANAEIDYASVVANTSILIIGAGGLGCELLKTAALMGFRLIDIIDMDTIDISNLNRQFLFRPKDVGRGKAEVAREFVCERLKHLPGLQVTAHNCRIEDKPIEWYTQFGLVMCGLDSVEARRWINRTLHDIRRQSADGDMIPMLDGGTESLKGQVRVILPGMSACYECTMGMHNQERKAYPICTIANTPRLAEHCIEWASVLEWQRSQPFGDARLDTDNVEHMQWVFKTAMERAQ